MLRQLLALLTATAAGVLLFPTSSAHACGGCFAPTGQPTVVTAHRMVVALSPTETTLWDQFEYAGEPEDFVWVLPVSGTQDVVLELADNAFFQALQQESQIVLQAPFRGSSGGGGFGCAAAADGAFAPESGRDVTVYHQAVVGPYETATIGSESSTALVDWLNEHDYAVTSDLLPIIDHYVAQEMNFVVLRLAPGESVTKMQPVRVTMPGLQTTFPLRMVSAGVTGSVALELFVLADGRYEAQNFGNVEIDRDALIYDWATGEFNYDDLAEASLAAAGGQSWLTEFAWPAVGQYGPIGNFTVRDDDGTSHGAADDWAVVTRSIDNPYLTRMRADLPVEALGQDLILRASLGEDLEGFVQVEQDVNWGGGAAPPGRSSAGGLPPLPYPIIGLAIAGTAIVSRRLRKRGRP